MKQTCTWIVVADGSEARILVHKSGERKLQQLPSGEIHEFAPPTRELVTDRLPRTQESGGPTRHQIEPRSDPHEQRKEKFLKRVIDYVGAAVQRKEFDGLVVIAPAPAMAVFRSHYPQAVKALIKQEIVHDYVHQDSDYIYQHIHDLIP
jgi:protein required for attachment to host cells